MDVLFSVLIVTFVQFRGHRVVRNPQTQILMYRDLIPGRGIIHDNSLIGDVGIGPLVHLLNPL